MSELTRADRCDVGECPAQALVLATFARGELLFCRRHYLAAQDEIDRSALHVLDETDKINARSESSA